MATVIVILSLTGWKLVSNYTEAKKFDEIINTGCMHWLPYDAFLCSQ